MGKVKGLYDLRRFGLGVLLLLGSVAIGFAQKLPSPTRVWSVGPLTKSEPVMGIAFGTSGATITGPHVNAQTGSIFAATRSVVFAGDRIVLASMAGMRRVEGTQNQEEVYQLLSLDAQTGEVKDTLEISAFGSLKVFATNDAHVIVSGRSLMRLTPDLKDAGSFDYHAQGHKFGRVQNISPDGSTLGNATSPGFELIDAHTLTAKTLSVLPLVDTGVSSKARRTLHPALKKLGIEKQGFHGFRRFRVTYLESNNVPQALIDYWTGHAKKSDGEDVQKTMNQIYTKMDKDAGFREDVAERIGFGFDLPKPAVVPSVPRNAVEVGVENAVEIVVK